MEINSARYIHLPWQNIELRDHLPATVRMNFRTISDNANCGYFSDDDNNVPIN